MSIALPTAPQTHTRLLNTAFKIWKASIIPTLPYHIIWVMMLFVSYYADLLKPQNAFFSRLLPVVVTVMTYFFYFAAYAAIIFRTHHILHSQDPGLLSPFIRGCQKALPLFLVLLLVSAATLLGLVLLVIPGVIIILYYQFAPYLNILGYGVIDSIKESYRLVKNHWWFTATNLTLLSLLVMLSIPLGILLYFLESVIFGVGVELFLGDKANLYIANIPKNTLDFALIMPLLPLLVAIVHYTYTFFLACLYDLQARQSKD